MKRWLLVLLPSAIVFVAVICLYFYSQERKPVLMSERWISATQKVRVLEYAPEGRRFSDYLVYRCEYYYRGLMWSCASYSSDSYKAGKAFIEVNQDHIVTVSLDGNPVYELDGNHNQPFGAYWTISESKQR